MASKARMDVRDFIKEGKESVQSLGVTIDGWNGINKKHMDGVMVKVERLVYPADCEEMGTNHNAVCTACGWEYLCAKLDAEWSYLTSDSAGQCARACQILALRHIQNLQ